MNTNIKHIFIAAGILALGLSSCTKDLDRKPIVQVTSESVYDDPASIKEALAKLYAGLSLSGQDVSASPDIASNDVGSNVYLRNFWEAEELPTDEAKIAWNDGDIQAYNTNSWGSTNTYVKLWYNRVFYEVSICNEFIRELPESKIASFGASDTANIRMYVNEARFLRALAYWHAIDNFGAVPFTTEKDAVGATSPKQASRDSVFSYVESELLAIQSLLPTPGANEYGRADQGAVWTLLAKLYLNAAVYTGTARNTDAVTYANKVISSNVYTLAGSYGDLFLTDNRSTGEIIFPVRANGLTSQSYGNTTFLVHAQVGGSMDAADSFGIKSGGWAGLRATGSFVDLYSDPSGNTDTRALFYTDGQTKDMSDLKTFTSGYAIKKYKNISSAGVVGSDAAGNFVDTDFPMFRLADVYLMYAEAVLRGGTGGDAATALNYINKLRDRAYGSAAGEIGSSDLTLNFILDERGRELYWEGHRRTDLIRFGKFTGGTYVWPWKGGAAAGTSIDDHYNLYPISYDDIVANPNLTQNTGY